MHRYIRTILMVAISLSLSACQSTQQTKTVNAPLQRDSASKDHSQAKEIIGSIAAITASVSVIIVIGYAMFRAGGGPSSEEIGAQKANDKQQHLNEWLYNENGK